ncbi:store-operated calcium entry-associated regulatory factor-like [Teratosphaeria destructans]|uniref:Store-operated calcium entry-associated regulatory factor n=1 Tax=Teratosphaeria destructans TaxID=418781 RepID=A0A9W7W255_9PEZI|nr:store-operated calcium entry-associated regulatory factor-like [Teratosphaeria destructans]
MRLDSLLLGLLLALTNLAVSAKSKARDAQLLSRVKALTFHDGRLTTARRSDPIPQMTCVGGNAKGLFAPDVMRCENAGSEYDTEDVQWTCKAQLPPEFKLGSTEVVCEGYDSPDDPYVLKGSCGVEYRLMLTREGEEKYGRNVYERLYKHPTTENIFSSLATTLFWLTFIGIVGIFLYRIFVTPRGGNGGVRNRGGWNWWGGGGGGHDGHDDPPPPYTPRAPKPKSSYSANRAGGQNADGTWRPGFWTGAATGAAASYAAQAAANAFTGRNRRPEYAYDDPQVGPSTWGRRTRDPDPPRTGFFNRPVRNSSPFGGGSSSFGAGPSAGPSSSRYESTGFGGTRRT